MGIGPDGTYQKKIYVKQGGLEEVVDVGGTLSMYGVENLNGVNVPVGVTFSIAPGSANQTLVTIQVVDNAGNALPYCFELDVYLSDAATGAGLTATTASGAVAAGSAGAVINTMVSKKALTVQTDATGKFILAITDTGNTGFYIYVAQTGYGFPCVSRQLVAGDY